MASAPSSGLFSAVFRWNEVCTAYRLPYDEQKKVESIMNRLYLSRKMPQMTKLVVNQEGDRMNFQLNYDESTHEEIKGRLETYFVNRMDHFGGRVKFTVVGPLDPVRTSTTVRDDEFCKCFVLVKHLHSRFTEPYARTTTYRNDDRDNYGRDNYNRDYNVTRTATYVRDDHRDRVLGFGDPLGSDNRGGYGYQTSGESDREYGQSYHGYGIGQTGQSYGGAQTDGQTYDRDNRGWSSSINDRDRTYGNESSRYTAGGEASARGGHYGSTTFDRPTGGDYSSSRTTYRGYGDNDRDNR